MRLRDLKKGWKDENGALRTGIILLSFAAFLYVFVIKFDTFRSVLRVIWGALGPFLWGIILAYVLNVFVHLFEDFVFRPLKNVKAPLWKKLRRPLAVLLSYLVVLGVVVFITCFIVPSLVQSLSTVARTAQETVPGYVNSAVQWVNEFAQKNNLTFLQDFLKQFNWGSLLADATKWATDFVGSLLSVTFNVATGVFSAIMSFIFSIYMLSGKEKLLRSFKSLLLAFVPERISRNLSKVGSLANRVFYSFIRGQLTECVILGTLCYVGMSILQLDYALLISSVVAMGALIPILGAYIGAAVGVIVLLIVHPIDALIFLIFLICLQQLEGNLIYPRVVGSSIGLPPIWTLFAVLFWGGILGIPGVMLGTPCTAVIYRLLRTSVHTRLREKGINPADPTLPPQKQEDVLIGEPETEKPSDSEDAAPSEP